MSNVDLIAAVQSGDLQIVRDLLSSKVDLNQKDDQGWTPLHYASGKGDLDLVKLLVEHGCDVAGSGRDQRTPYAVALAAGRAEVARYLRELEDANSAEGPRRPARKYCKAYYLRDLRKYVNWSEAEMNKKASNGSEVRELTDESIVFIHQDLTVTRSMWPNEDLIFTETSPEWNAFCAEELRFSVPDDLDLIPAASIT